MMGRFPLYPTEAVYEPPEPTGATASSLPDQAAPMTHKCWTHGEFLSDSYEAKCPKCGHEAFCLNEAAFVPPARGKFVLPPAVIEAKGGERLTRLPDGSYGWRQPMMFELGGALLQEPPAYRCLADWDNEAARWLDKAMLRIKLRRCKPMIERLRKLFYAAADANIEKAQGELHSSLYGEDDYVGVPYGATYELREAAVNLEVYNALQ